ncbi:unnamed protein product [Acanthoscelides obtectus]|uniref:DDE Tnp4 domain-containing protein n=1 Tax=Acanthoscelides obtectus TaxID=200917 RepID=A0A9P0KWX9_ACAOB|nr:unnamed protein product [Acanthoscelides obtectus]CAK1642329.1 hypothetical protein AOBTE_LOCUS12978 [Acanthoscelides obtectus]
MEIEECIAVWYLLNNKKKKLKRRRSLWVHPMLGLRESKGTYLATGCSLTELHYNYRVGISTASEIIQETCKLIWIFMKEQCIPKPTREKWLEIAYGFLKNANYPHCLGAIDGKHIRNLSSKKLDLPNPDFLPQKNDYKIPYVIVRDEAFGLSFNVMRPYGGKNLTLKKRIHNYRLTRARRYIECTFGILSNKWRIFHRPLNVSIDFAVDIVKACTVLHNSVRVLDGYKHEDALSVQGFYDANVAKTGACSARSATAIRDYFADYFMNTDILPWQNSCIM